mmetsp:Transcript_30060/g.95836  ORF Transcript_30060/g.95836 Transcript_30060/m.95836 type:complete len:242 (-) Transcript_30060:2097-2822(-)
MARGAARPLSRMRRLGACLRRCGDRPRRQSATRSPSRAGSQAHLPFRYPRGYPHSQPSCHPTQRVPQSTRSLLAQPAPRMRCRSKRAWRARMARWMVATVGWMVVGRRHAGQVAATGLAAGRMAVGAGPAPGGLLSPFRRPRTFPSRRGRGAEGVQLPARAAAAPRKAMWQQARRKTGQRAGRVAPRLGTRRRDGTTPRPPRSPTRVCLQRRRRRCSYSSAAWPAHASSLPEASPAAPHAC